MPTDDRSVSSRTSLDRFERVRSISDGEKEYLQGVIEFYRTRTETKMTVAAERLAVIAVVTLPITALSSVLGMNLIVNDRTDFPLLGPGAARDDCHVDVAAHLGEAAGLVVSALRRCRR